MPQGSGAFDLQPLFEPRSVAIVGASPSARTASVIRNFQRLRYPGLVYPVHPRHREVLGLPCYPDLASVPGPIDLAIIAVGAEGAPGALDEAGQAGARAAIVFAGGFAEAGPEGRRRQEHLREIAERYGIALAGPNCLGLVSVVHRVGAYLEEIPYRAAPGSVGAVCQSGWATIALVMSGRIGISQIVASGTEAVLDAVDHLEYLVDDPHTSVVAAFLETVRSPGRFLRLAERAREAGKPLVVLKVGTSVRAADAALWHTGSVLEPDADLRSAAADRGVIFARDLDELIDTLAVFSLLGRRLPDGRRIGAITNSGGQVGVLFDLAERVGVELPELTQVTQQALADVLPVLPTVSNPLDLDNHPLEAYVRCLELLLADERVDLLAVCPPAYWHRRTAELAQIAALAARTSPKPVVFLAASSDGLGQELRDVLAGAGVPLLAASESGLRVLAHVLAYGDARHRSPVAVPVVAG